MVLVFIHFQNILPFRLTNFSAEKDAVNLVRKKVKFQRPRILAFLSMRFHAWNHMIPCTETYEKQEWDLHGIQPIKRFHDENAWKPHELGSVFFRSEFK